MLTYSKEAQESYINTIEEMQRKLANVIPDENLTNCDLHWLIHKALNDLKTQVKKER